MIRMSVSVLWNSAKNFLNVKNGRQWVLLYACMYVFIYWTFWRKTLRVIFLVNDYRPALKDSMIPCKSSSLVFFHVSDFAASEICADVSEHSVPSSYDLRRWNIQSVPNLRQKNSDAGESPKRKNTTFRTRPIFLSYLRLLHFMCPKRRGQGLVTSKTSQWTKINKRKETVYYVIWE